MKKKANIQDVAERAGVSVASVSYVINGVDKVSEETRRRILSAIEELHYKPSFIAQGLSSGKLKLIGVTLPITESEDIPGDLLENNPFFGEFLSGLENAVYKNDYDILVSGVSVHSQYKDWIQRRGLDGIVMLGAYPKSFLEELKDLNIPVVLTDVYDESASFFHCVRVDDELGGYIATRHLIRLGHRSIAFAAGSIRNSYVNYHRFGGYLRALREAGITPDESLVFEDHVTFDGGYRVGRERLLRQERATAVFAAADIMAIGIIKAMQENGKKVPDDLSVVGFDDIQFGRYMVPELTTVRQDIVLKGQVSAQMIIDDLNAKTRSRTSMVLRPELVIRGSTAPAHADEKEAEFLEDGRIEH